MIRLIRIKFKDKRSSQFICRDCIDRMDDFFGQDEQPIVFEDDTIVDRECPVCHRCDDELK